MALLENNNIIFVAAHFDSKVELNKIHHLIEVGSAKREKNFAVIRDDRGENISSLNNNFCELTALYWIWKNNKAEGFVGLSHYRRMFLSPSGNDKLFDEADLLKFKGNTVFLPRKEAVKILGLIKVSVRNQYKHCHFIDDWNRIGNIISNKCPEYANAFEEVSNSRSLYFYNMIIMQKNLVDSYCEWLFDLLFTLKNQKSIAHYDTYQSRVYGFLSERLLNVFLTKNKNEFDIVELNTTFKKKAIVNKIDLKWISSKAKKYFKL